MSGSLFLSLLAIIAATGGEPLPPPPPRDPDPDCPCPSCQKKRKSTLPLQLGDNTLRDDARVGELSDWPEGFEATLGRPVVVESTPGTDSPLYEAYQQQLRAGQAIMVVNPSDTPDDALQRLLGSGRYITEHQGITVPDIEALVEPPYLLHAPPQPRVEWAPTPPPTPKPPKRKLSPAHPSEVACPSCGAPANYRCHKSNGVDLPPHRMHPARKDALRALRPDVSPQGR